MKALSIRERYKSTVTEIVDSELKATGVEVCKTLRGIILLIAQRAHAQGAVDGIEMEIKRRSTIVDTGTAN